MAKTPEEQRLSHNRSQAIYRATAKGKRKEETWRGSPAGHQAVKKNNQTQRDKRRDTLNKARAEEQQRLKDAERRLTEAKEKWGEPYDDENGVRRFRKPKGNNHGKTT